MQTGAWSPKGVTFSISAPTSSPPAGVQATFFNDAPPQATCVFRLRNPSLSNDVRFGYGNSAAEAQTNAAALPSKSVSVGPGQVEYVQANAGTYWSALALTATTAAEVQPGDIS